MTPSIRTCGSCTLCCKVMAVSEIAKERGVWCTHAQAGTGCRIYDHRPRSCRTYNCLWLTEPSLGDHLRPDKTKAVLLGYRDDGGQKAIVAICDHGDPMAWKRRPVIDLLRISATHGHPAFAMAGQRCWQVHPDSERQVDGLPNPAATDMLAETAADAPDTASSGA